MSPSVEPTTFLLHSCPTNNDLIVSDYTQVEQSIHRLVHKQGGRIKITPQHVLVATIVAPPNVPDACSTVLQVFSFYDLQDGTYRIEYQHVDGSRVHAATFRRRLRALVLGEPDTICRLGGAHELWLHNTHIHWLAAAGALQPLVDAVADGSTDALQALVKMSCPPTEHYENTSSWELARATCVVVQNLLWDGVQRMLTGCVRHSSLVVRRCLCALLGNVAWMECKGIIGEFGDLRRILDQAEVIEDLRRVVATVHQRAYVSSHSQEALRQLIEGQHGNRVVSS